MAESKKTWKYQYLVTIPDFPNSLSARLEVRPKHLSELKPLLESGQVICGGAFLNKQPEEGETPDMAGSVMIIKADSEEEVRAWMEKDQYTEGKVWDIKNAKIVPFKCAVLTHL